MASRRRFALWPVLTMALIVACSNGESAPPRNAGLSEATQHDHAETSPSNTDGVGGQRESGADSEPTQVTRSADSHTHGDAELAVVLEGGRLIIELDSPLYNLLGFEHAPTTEAQKARVSFAETQLGRGEQLFTFNDRADCTITSAEQSVRLFSAHAPDEPHHDEHEGEEEDTHNDHDGSAHKDVLLRYAFLCQKPSALSKVSLNLFEFFGELSEIDVTYLGPATQKQVTLTRNQIEMDISK